MAELERDILALNAIRDRLERSHLSGTLGVEYPLYYLTQLNSPQFRSFVVTVTKESPHHFMIGASLQSADGSQTHLDALPSRLEFDIVLPTVRSQAEFELSKEARLFVEIFRANPNNRKEQRELLRNISENDPLRYLPSEVLFAWAEKNRAHMLIEVNDSWLSTYVRLGETPSIAEVLSRAKAGLERTAEGWARITFWEAATPVRNADRAVVQSFIDASGKAQAMLIEPVAYLAASIDGEPQFGILFFLGLAMLDVRGVNWIGDELALALFGKLDLAQRSLLLRGEPLNFSSLRPEQQRFVEKLVYGNLGASYMRSRNDEEWVDPSKALGKGIPQDTTLVVKDQRDAAFYVTDKNQPSGLPRPVDQFELAQALLYERHPELRPARHGTTLTIGRVATAERRTLRFTFLFGESGTMTFELRDYSPPGMLGLVEQLPTKIKEQLDKTIARQEKFARQRSSEASNPAERPPRP